MAAAPNIGATSACNAAFRSPLYLLVCVGVLAARRFAPGILGMPVVQAREYSENGVAPVMAVKQILVAHTREQLANIAKRIAVLPVEKPVSITIAEWSPPQKRSQRNYFEATIAAAAEHFGYVGASEIAQFREQLLFELEGGEEVEVGNKTFYRRRTTARHDRAEFGERIEMLLVKLAHWGYVAPPRE